MTDFHSFGLSPALSKRLAAANFSVPTPVQAGAIPPALAGSDVLATAQTGTGKTLSFLIPLIERMQEAQGKGIFGLVLLPTRELAMQVQSEYRKFSTSASHASALVVGGLPEGPQLQAIRRGARLLIATPGRLEDYLDRNLVRLDGVQILVLDEVDRMLDMGFQPAIRRIVGTLPASRQTLCYSATLEAGVRDIANTYLRAPVRVEIGTLRKPADNVELQTFEVEADKKLPLLEHLLGSDPGSFLVFVRTKHGADKIARKLANSGWSATRIHGDRTQAQRTAALKSFSQGQHRVLVATDVAARGIDVAHVAHVVNYDLPKEADDFVHRVGRTGRAERRGIASTFAAPEQQKELRKIEKTLRVSMKRFRVKDVPAPGANPLRSAQ